MLSGKMNVGTGATDLGRRNEGSRFRRRSKRPQLLPKA